MSIFVIGDRDTVLGMGLVGVEGATVQSVAQARTTLDKTLSQPHWKIILITRQWAAQMQAELDQLKMTTLEPVIVEIPGSQLEPPGQSLRKSVEALVGIRLGK